MTEHSAEKGSAGVSANVSVSVDDKTLYELVSAGMVSVHRSGSRQRKHGTHYDYRSHYRALRVNRAPRPVIAFGSPEGLAAKLAAIGITLCYAHARPALTVGRWCDHCQKVAKRAAAWPNTTSKSVGT